MALSSISISIENNPYKGYIDITSNRNVSSLGNIAYIHIFHRQYNVSQSYQKIYEIKVETLDDLDFIIHDYTCVAGLHYQYYIEVADGNQAGYTVLENETISNVECYFEGLYIGTNMQLPCNSIFSVISIISLTNFKLPHTVIIFIFNTS